MKPRFGIAIVVGLGLMAHAGMAQTVAEQMQKAIYDQETAGNLDGAIQIYRQILTSAPTKENAAEAQFRLAEALLQKGDLTGAAQEFQVLSQVYPQSKDLIAAMASKMQGSGDRQRGVLEDGHFRNFLTNVDLTIPDGYKFAGCGMSSDDGEMAFLNSSVKPSVQVWMKPEVVPASNLDALLRIEPVNKTNMRDATWKVRQETIQEHSVNGQPGLSAIADYAIGNKRMVEYFIWVQTGKTHLQFYGQAEPDQLSALQNSVDRVANLASIP